MIGGQRKLPQGRTLFQRKTGFQRRNVSQSQRGTPRSPSLWKSCGRPLTVLVVFVIGFSRVNRIPRSAESSAGGSESPLTAAAAATATDSNNDHTNNPQIRQQRQGQQKSAPSTIGLTAIARNTSAPPSAHVIAMSSLRPKQATLSSTATMMTTTTNQKTFTAGPSGSMLAVAASTSSRTITGVGLPGRSPVGLPQGPRSRLLGPGNTSTPPINPTDCPSPLSASPSPIASQKKKEMETIPVVAATRMKEDAATATETGEICRRRLRGSSAPGTAAAAVEKSPTGSTPSATPTRR